MTTTKAEASRKKAAIKAAAALQKATAAVHAYSMACYECSDGSQIKSADDGRLVLCEKMTEYSGWLSSVYAK